MFGSRSSSNGGKGTGYKQTATQTTKFTYDALGRRTSKTHHTGDEYSPETKTTFSWDGLRLLSETTQTVRGDKTSLYIYADSESYEPLARVDTINSIAAEAINTPANDKIFHFHNDLNGLPQELSTEGEFVWKATYKVWGNVATEEWTGEYQHAQQLGETQNLRFQGQYYDQETGLHYNTFRFFDPDVGRFTSPDPIELAGGNNLYQYAPNPFGWIDPWGLTCIANKTAGSAREARVGGKLDGKFGKPNVLRERYLRDSNGKIMRDANGSARRVDFVVKGKDGKGTAIEVTSKTADKRAQIAKEIDIRNKGGTYVRDPVTKKLIEVRNVSREVRVK